MEKLEENTIIFTSDNGPWLSYGGHSGSAGILGRVKGLIGKVSSFLVSYYPNKIKANTKLMYLKELIGYLQ